MNLTPASNSSWALHMPLTPIDRLCSGAYPQMLSGSKHASLKGGGSGPRTRLQSNSCGRRSHDNSNPEKNG